MRHYRYLQTQDPFWEPLETPTLVGVVCLPLEALAYMIDIGEQRMRVYDPTARSLGHLTVAVMPCDAAGTEEPEALAADDPRELVCILIKLNNNYE